ncbi:unnamed protein product [Rotaria magnacalcarata]|uniref:Uncharacterized protein n=1 Tax=Rotaria magnacalcarata TaxID=392030 RepID=A0A820BQI0_9BILA|nr:unnamed protein product [Rotaria magnacalcarata]
MLELIVLHANLYAKRYYDKKIRPRQDSNNIRSDSHFWKPVDRIELESFIGLLIQSGVHRTRAARTDELTSPIIHSTLRTYPLSDAGQLPKNEPLILMIQRQRTTETVETDGRLPEKLRKTYRDEGFILHEDKN